ncbi:MAG TPA: hypothetical protein VIX89_17840, partial [Bryobacteraceae bacterium]
MRKLQPAAVLNWRALRLTLRIEPFGVGKSVVLAPVRAGPGSQYPSILFSDLPWDFVSIHTSAYVEAPAFAWNGVWVIK